MFRILHFGLDLLLAGAHIQGVADSITRRRDKRMTVVQQQRCSSPPCLLPLGTDAAELSAKSRTAKDEIG